MKPCKMDIEKIESMQALLKAAGAEVAHEIRWELEEEYRDWATNRLLLLLDVLRHCRENKPGFLSPAEHFAVNSERVALFRALEALDEAVHNRSLHRPKAGVPDVGEIVPGSRVPPGVERKVGQVAQWLALKSGQ